MQCSGRKILSCVLVTFKTERWLIFWSTLHMNLTFIKLHIISALDAALLSFSPWPSTWTRTWGHQHVCHTGYACPQCHTECHKTYPFERDTVHWLSGRQIIHQRDEAGKWSTAGGLSGACVGSMWLSQPCAQWCSEK